MAEILPGAGIEKKRFDAIVLGLGAMGSAAVYQLAKSGANVLGIDQYRPPHKHGSTHGDTRATRVANFEGPELVSMVRRAHEIYRELEEETGQELFDQRGGLIFGKPDTAGYHSVEDPFASTVAAAEQYEVEHELLTPEKVSQRWPVFGFEGNETAYFEREGGVLFPERCIEAQLGLAARYGAQLALGEKAFFFDDHKGSVSVATDKNVYQADKLIISAGPWVKEIMPDYDPLFTLERQTLFWFDLKDKSQYETYRDLPRGGWAYDEGAYYFPALDGPDGGIKIACENGTPVESPEAVNRTVLQEEIDRMYEVNVRDRLPGVSGNCLRAATCLYTMTPDGKFIIDRHHEQENVIVASPCNGNGFKHSAAIGEVLAQMASGSKMEIDISAFSIARFLR